MRNRNSGKARAAVSAALLLLMTLGAWGQSAETIEAFTKGPHTGSVQEALVGIEVTNFAADGKTRQTRHANGFVLRCDGFVLAPTDVFSFAMTGQKENATGQVIFVVLHPGTANEKRVKVRAPIYYANFYPQGLLGKPYALGYTCVKMNEIHTPALRTLLPDSLRGGGQVQVFWSAWDDAAGHFLAPTGRTATLASNDKYPKDSLAGDMLFAEAQPDIPTGAVVIGPDGFAVGLVKGPAEALSHNTFVTFTVLDLLTNCVTPLSVPDGQSEAGAGGAGGGMIAIPGGPILLPGVVQMIQPDMETATTACVAPFEIDKYEVTNGEYLEFWKSLPDKEGKDRPDRYFPAGWVQKGPPFPAEIASVPVLGVPVYGMKAYAHYRGKRLPTPAEWCLAAFGPKGATELLDCAKQYIAARNEVAQQIQDDHIDFVLHNDAMDPREFLIDPRYPNSTGPPEITVPLPGALGPHRRGQPAVDPTVLNLKGPIKVHTFELGAIGGVPWLAYISTMVNYFDQLIAPPIDKTDVLMQLTDWSRKTVTADSDALWKTWADPLYVVPVGTRLQDVSHYGVSDMIFNADELMFPPPFPPARGQDYYIHVDWTSLPSSQIPYKVFLAPGLDYTKTRPPLSRLLDRSSPYPPLNYLLALASEEEIVRSIYPISGWDVQLIPGRFTQWTLTYVPDFINKAKTAGAAHFFLENAFGYRDWIGKPAHYRTEMGPLPPLGETDASFVKSGTLTYLNAAGFRCAR